MNKILIVPTRRHIIESYYEYIIRYLSNEFIIDQGFTPYPPYEEFEIDKNSNGNNSLMKNPDKYDLLLPQFATHWNYWGDEHWHDKSKSYAYKTALVYLEPHSLRDAAIYASTSKATKEFLGERSHHDLRFGVDTQMFKPYPMLREDDLLHVGFVGNIQTPRRYIKELFMQLKDIDGIRLMVFPTEWTNKTRPDEVELMGGQALLNSIVDGDKWYAGLPNIYNQMDIFIRCDIDHGCQLSVMEAAACGVPVVCTDSGYTKELCDAGGGICIDPGKTNPLWDENNLARIAKEIREAVIELRDSSYKRKLMGSKGRNFIETAWTWDKFIPAWREFFREGIKSAQKA